MSADLENYLTPWKVVNDKIMVQDISADLNNFISLSKNMVMTNHSSSLYFLVDFQFEYNEELKFLVVKINQDFITSLQKQLCFFISDGTHEFKIKIIPNLIETLLIDWLNYSGN
jgi:hypothetical protein|tara:strand:- start:211 stop:552 length:342 start_codon:yes stop_codon:yes gene_type:complete